MFKINNISFKNNASTTVLEQKSEPLKKNTPKRVATDEEKRAKLNEMRYNDPLQRWPLKSLSFSNEIGAAISEIAPKLGTLLWVPTILYFGADIYDKYKNDKQSYSPSKKRGTEQAIFQAFSGIVLPTAAVVTGQKLMSPLGKLFSDKLSLNQKDAAIHTLLDFMEQEKFKDYTNNVSGYKNKFHKFIENRITYINDERAMTNPVSRFFKNIFGCYSLANAKKGQLSKYLDQNIDKLFAIRADLMKKKKNQFLPNSLFRAFQKQEATFKQKYMNDYLAHSAKLTLKNYEKVLLFQNKLIKTAGGFIVLGLMLEPISKFTEHVIIKKYVDPSIDTLDEKIHSDVFQKNFPIKFKKKNF